MAYTKIKLNGEYTYVYTPPCHLEKPLGTNGKDYMIEAKKASLCNVCKDSKRCWDQDTLKVKINEEYIEQEKNLRALQRK